MNAPTDTDNTPPPQRTRIVLELLATALLRWRERQRPHAHGQTTDASLLSNASPPESRFALGDSAHPSVNGNTAQRPGVATR